MADAPQPLNVARNDGEDAAAPRRSLGERFRGLWATIRTAIGKDISIVILSSLLLLAIAILVSVIHVKPDTKVIPAIFPDELYIPDIYPAPPLTNFTGLRGRQLYVFGDSSVDPENYNATKFPYGMDLNNRASGRFTNGFTIADYLGKFLRPT